MVPGGAVTALAADGQRQRSFEHEHQRVERRGVLAQAFAGVEREQRDVAASGLGKNAAGDAALGWRNQVDESQRFSRWEWRRPSITLQSFEMPLRKSQGRRRPEPVLAGAG